MKVHKLFRKTLFGVLFLFFLILLSTSLLWYRTIDRQLSEEYETNSRNIAKTIADSSVDILLNRDLSALQSLIDQFAEIQSIDYIYITSETGEFLAHTFIPGIPEDIRGSDPNNMELVERQLRNTDGCSPGACLAGSFVEVGSPILAGVAGTVHVGMNTDHVSLKVQRAIGQQNYLISILVVVGFLSSIWFVNLAAKPLGDVLGYAVALARGDAEADAGAGRVLERDDEAGHLARLVGHLSRAPAAADGPERPGADGDPVQG